MSTGELSRVSGTVGVPPPAAAVSGRPFGVPGSHSTSFSPIRLSGRTAQAASERNGAKPASISIDTRALCWRVTRTAVT